MNKTADMKAYNKAYYQKYQKLLKGRSNKRRQEESTRIKALKDEVNSRWDAKYN